MLSLFLNVSLHGIIYIDLHCCVYNNNYNVCLIIDEFITIIIKYILIYMLVDH
jgi:hypothetical protein